MELSGAFYLQQGGPGIGERTAERSIGERTAERMADIVLDDATLATFCRRGRRRLRDLQASCNVTLRLDRVRSLLRVTGAAENIDMVRKQLATMNGPRRAVPAAVWAELMRTRTMSGSEEALIEMMQEKCGCRVHIERSRHEVRIFGDEEGVRKADEILSELATQCAQACVPINDSAQLAGASLQALAHQCGVSLRIEQCRVIVFGRKTSLMKAVEELRSYIADPAGHPLASVQVPAEDEPCSTNPAANNGVEDDQDCRGSGGGACSGCGSCRTCPTCGSGRFCSNCGTTLWQVNPETVFAAMVPYQVAGCPQFGSGHMVAGAASAGLHDESTVAWAPNYCFMPTSPQSAATASMGPGTSPAASNQMMPVCMVPAAAHGAASASAAGGSMMQACMAPAAMVSPMAFYSMPSGAGGAYSAKQDHLAGPYLAQDNPGMGG